MREGLIIEKDGRFAEIAPLPSIIQRGQETLDEALNDLRTSLQSGTPPNCPSVRFGLFCLQYPLQNVHLPLCALGPREGFSTIKLKVGHLPIQEAIDQAKKYKHLKLRLDCNQAWSLAEALHFASHFSPADFDYLEEPLRSWDELIQFSHITKMPIALDESDCNERLQIPTLKAVVVKPTCKGTIPHLAPHLQLILSSSFESGIGLLHIARIAQHINPTSPIGLDTTQFFDDNLLTHPIVCAANTFSWNNSSSPVHMDKLCPVVL